MRRKDCRPLLRLPAFANLRATQDLLLVKGPFVVLGGSQGHVCINLAEGSVEVG